MPKISICIPYHDTPRTAFFLSRLLNSIDQQSFKDYEIVLTNEPGMAHNHNAAILKSKGELIQMMQMDDYFAHSQALGNIVESLENNEWAISACLHNDDGFVGRPHTPSWTEDILTGNNRLGSISTLAMRKDKALLFEEPLQWVVDCDLYYRLYREYGPPHLGTTPSVIIDTRTDRLTHTLSNELKNNEVQYVLSKYVNREQ